MRRPGEVLVERLIAGLLDRHRRRRLLARGLTGAFNEPEHSDRAAALTQEWERKWSRAEPVGHLLRSAYGSRWVRLHSLPGAKRYPTSPEEEREVLRRHQTLLAELQGEDEDAFIVIAVDWGWRDGGTGWSRALLPESWPWRILPIFDEDPDEPDHADNTHYFWVASEVSRERLASLLLAAAADRAHFLVTDSGLDWLYCPYDGGADVILSSAAERDDLRSTYAAWRSARPDGL